MQTRNVLIIQNDQIETLGIYEAYLQEQKINHAVFHAYEVTSLAQFPSLLDFDLFIIGPTPISVREIAQHPFLQSECMYIDALIDSGKPCLGVCCGAQLLAKRLGASVTQSPCKEIGGYTLKLTPDGTSDRLFQGFPSAFPVFHWHSDQFSIPPGGTLLVTGDPCVYQAFAWRNVRGLLFHLELDRQDVARWARIYKSELREVGKTYDQVIQECIEHESQMSQLASQLMANFYML